MVTQRLPVNTESDRVLVEGTRDGHAWLRAWGAQYAAGRVRRDTGEHGGERMGLFEADERTAAGAALDVPRASVHVLEGIVDATAALMVPPLAATLRIWDDLRLEIGELAVVTDGHPLSALAALAASWHGARAVLVTGGKPAPINGVSVVRLHDQVEPLACLASVFQDCVAAAVLELGGAAEIVDAVLESVPASSRLLFASDAPEKLTVDFYRNVHRKGLDLQSGTAGPRSVFSDVDASRRQELFLRACRLLADPGRVEACRAALEPTDR
ncbi:MAG: hypothetical protein IT179_09015 [Acidobacteria bacterium]|nr:hypothetical protein [Acidobacteriota bacterium]